MPARSKYPEAIVKPEDRIYTVFDYETFSEAPLKEVGAFEYSVHPSTEILCVAWRTGTRTQLRNAKTKLWIPSLPEHSPYTWLHFFRALTDESTTLVAHNMFFETCITLNVFSRLLSGTHAVCLEEAFYAARLICTAARAAALALPRNLEGAANVLNLAVKKDMEGAKLLAKHCKPRKPTKKDPSTRHNSTDELLRIAQYCVTDIDVEVELLLSTPPLTPQEQALWEIDQAINWHGFAVDRPLVGTILDMIDIEMTRVTERVRELSSGELNSAGQIDALINWLAKHQAFLPDLQKKTVEDALAGKLTPIAREMLTLRQAAARTSTKKYVAFESNSRHQARARGCYLFHGASTGRWAGARVQPQNLVRSHLKFPDIERAISIIQPQSVEDTDDDVAERLELLRMMYGPPMPVFASMLRSMIIADEGYTLDVGDYAAIEVRVLFWLADHERGLQAFREGRDLYIEQAASVYNKPASQIGKESTERFFGKTLVLGCGFGTGADKFMGVCAQVGQTITKDFAQHAINSYRTMHWPVVKLWGLYERAAMEAVKNPGKRFHIKHTIWFVRGDFLYCELPSGRRLAYHKPYIAPTKTAWGETKPTLFHFGIDAKTHKWRVQKTWGGVLVENVTQAVAREIMAAAMVRIHNTGVWRIVLHSHDELGAERPLRAKHATNARFKELMTEVPEWAEGMPIKVEAWEGGRYKK